MATPSSHKTSAETLLTALTAAPTGYSLSPSETDWRIAQAHSRLSSAAGTGAHYTAAEAALTIAQDTTGAFADMTKRDAAQAAMTHALLAD